MRILFLHGLESTVGGAKPEFLKGSGHDVVEPSLGGVEFEEALTIAQAYVSKYGPEIIVGSSRGGALAMSLVNTGARLVLVAPAWSRYGSVSSTPQSSIIIHSEHDDLISYEDSVALSKTGGAQLVSAGEDHRMNDSSALSAILDAVERQ